MKLYDVPINTWIRIKGDIRVPPAAPQLKEGQKLLFHHIDGMYSYCETESGEVVHLVALAEVEIIK